MPDEIATRATLMLTIGLMGCLGIGALVSLVWTRLLRQPAGPTVGAGVGLALLAAGLSWVVWDMALVTWERRNHPVVQGTLLGYVPVTLSESRSGRKAKTSAPLVEFEAPDGRVYEVRGLGGSLAGREPGTRVPVRVRPDDPARSVIEDFQNENAALALFGGMAALAGLGTLQTLARLVFPATADGAPPRRGRAQASRWMRWERWRDAEPAQRWRARMRTLTFATAALAIIGLFVAAEFVDVGRAFACTFFGLGVATLQGGVASMLAKGRGSPLDFTASLIGALAFVGFGALLWALMG